MDKNNGEYYLKKRAYSVSNAGDADTVLQKINQAKQASKVIKNTTRQYEQIVIVKLEDTLQRGYGLKNQSGVVQFLTKLSKLPTDAKQKVLDILNNNSQSSVSNSGASSNETSNTTAQSSSASDVNSASASSSSSSSDSAMYHDKNGNPETLAQHKHNEKVNELFGDGNE